MAAYNFAETMRCIEKYGTSDPYTLLEKMKVNFKLTYAYPENGLKGYCTIMNRSMYVRVNGKLNDMDQKISAAHEGGHLIFHQRVVLRSPMSVLKSYELYSIKNRYESETNFFVADFLISDADVMLIILEDPDIDYFKIANILNVPSPLLNFKLYSMMRRGLPVKNPEPLDSRFLK